MKNIEVNLEALFDEIVERGREEGITAEQAYHELVEEVVMDHLDVGEASDASDTAELTAQMRNRFPNYQEALGVTGMQDEVDL